MLGIKVSMKSLILALACNIFIVNCFSQIQPLIHAHAHNDYAHAHPLSDALNFGFTSIEADIFLIDNELYVSHERPSSLKGISLKELYLTPLQKLIKKNGNGVYKNFEGVFYLMIDLKSDALPTYELLKKEILEYPQFINNQHFRIFLTSYQDLHFIQKDSSGIIGIDGRPDDLGKGYSKELMPVISQTFKKISKWNGIDSIPEEDLQKIKMIACKTHQEGKKLRFWAIPDIANVWKTLLDAGVDIINTDKLEELNQFLIKYQQK